MTLLATFCHQILFTPAVVLRSYSPPCGLRPQGGAWPFYHGRRRAPGLLKRQAKTTTHQRKLKRHQRSVTAQQGTRFQRNVAALQQAKSQRHSSRSPTLRHPRNTKIKREASHSTELTDALDFNRRTIFTPAVVLKLCMS